ncbi:hypothetical protein T09_4364 [Trichinella sp. T9]|nr:hypothetical protein T09_4364 [Trichinella sp. T9]
MSYSTSGVGKEFRKEKKKENLLRLIPNFKHILQIVTRNKMETFPRNRNKKYTKRASCKIANENSVIRKFCLRHRLSQVHFLVEKEDGSIRFCQKQINARWSVTHGNQLMLKNFSCKVHNDEPKSEKIFVFPKKK